LSCFWCLLLTLFYRAAVAGGFSVCVFEEISMRASLSLILLLLAMSSPVPAASPIEIPDQPQVESRVQGWLVKTVRDPWGQKHSISEPYDFQEGDIVFFQSGSLAWQNLFSFHGSTGPTHVGIAMRNETGEVGLLHALDPSFGKPVETGPGIHPGHVCWTPNMANYLSRYDGRIYIRRYRGAFPEQAGVVLRNWAARQIGKPYGLVKVSLPPTGLPIQVLHLGGSGQVETKSWFCSELVASALVVTGHLNPWHVRPVRTDPEDLYSDRWLALGTYWESPELWMPASQAVSEGETTAAKVSDRSTHQQYGLASSWGRLTLKNRTKNMLRIRINGAWMGDVASGAELIASGPGGGLYIQADPSAGQGSSYRYSLGISGSMELTIP